MNEYIIDLVKRNQASFGNISEYHSTDRIIIGEKFEDERDPFAVKFILKTGREFKETLPPKKPRKMKVNKNESTERIEIDYDELFSAYGNTEEYGPSHPKRVNCPFRKQL